MALARCNFAIQDDAGNLVDGASVTVEHEEVGFPLLSVPYSDEAGTISLGNPYTAADGGDAGFYAVGGRYRITVTHASFGTRIWRHVPVGLAAGTDFGGGEDTAEEFTGATGTIATDTTMAAVNRAAPAATALTLPDASLRNGRDLHIVDYSTSVTGHVITLTPHSAAQTIMRQSTWQLGSSASNLASVTLRPIVDPDNSANYVWVIAP